MKRFLYLFVCALPLFFVASCDDDDKDLPNADFTMQISGGEFVNGQIYVVPDTTLIVESVGVINNEQGKKAIITYADYFLNGRFVGQSVVAPYGIEIIIPADMPVGKYSLQVNAPIYAVDKSPAFGCVLYTVNVVSSVDEIPDGGESSYQNTPSIQENEPTVK